jgi:hypothetical protein
MPNPQLDQFVQSLFWKIAPWILVASAIGTFAGLFVKWLDRSATGLGEKIRKRRGSKNPTFPSKLEFEADDAPHCPICKAVMVKRTAKRGAKAGSKFWGCPDYPRCRGTRPI